MKIKKELSEEKGLSPIADLMPGGGVEATVFILQGLPRCSTPPLFWPIFSESGIVFSLHDLVWPGIIGQNFWPPFTDL